MRLPIVFFNPAAEELTGVPRGRVLGESCARVFPAAPLLSDMVARVQRQGQSESRGEEQIDLRHRTVPVRLSCIPLWDQADRIRGTALVIHDLSHQRRLEESARRNESLAGLGTLVPPRPRGADPLAGIKGAAQLLEGGSTRRADLRQYTTVIVREVDRLSRLVEDLLALGAPPKPRLAALNIHRVIQHVLALAGEELTQRGISLRCEFDPSLPDVQGDDAQLNQVFLNLLKNAIEAMNAADPIQPGAGITISTRMETDFHILREQDRSGQFLRIEFADHGVGIGSTTRPGSSSPSHHQGPRHGARARHLEPHHRRARRDHAPRRISRAATILTVTRGEPRMSQGSGAASIPRRRRTVVRWVLATALEEVCHNVVQVAGGDEALQHLRNGAPDLAFIDIRMPDVDGLTCSPRLRAASRRRSSSSPRRTRDNAIEHEARRYDYITSRSNIEKCARSPPRARDGAPSSDLATSGARAARTLRARVGIGGSSPAMQEIYKAVGRPPKTDAPVLIRARAARQGADRQVLHYHSRAGGPFLALNCAAIPRDLLESELFATRRRLPWRDRAQRPCKFELAQGGTLFLDEVGDMPLELQAKMLRVLQEREVTRSARAGDPHRLPIIAATNSRRARHQAWTLPRGPLLSS